MLIAVLALFCAKNVVFLLGRPKSQYTAIVFVANTVRVLSLRNVLPFSAVFLLSKPVLILSLFLRLEDGDSAVRCLSYVSLLG